MDEQPTVIDDAMLKHLDAEQDDARTAAGIDQRNADAMAERAAHHRTRVSVLDAARAFIIPRMGMTLEQVLAEVDEELAKAETAAAGARAEAERLREQHRDLEGYIRIAKVRLAELREQQGLGGEDAAHAAAILGIEQAGG